MVLLSVGVDIFHHNDSPERTTVWLLVAWEFRVITVFYSRLGGHRRHLSVFVSLHFLADHQHCVSIFMATTAT